ncbi:hydrogenase formation protein HypD [Bacillus sp. ISL-47]|uniref:hydrogenase formation protein HypD n=1 Tax=Bacillus sp. ISL-47 TaxID=2819130 RepID=UPI001BEABF6B|nr:hydrogenase formation protein HypD [Bacillus sp. ISL-47]MBT2689539.1 hydrogenase formation protein HypD [Bacillus sp. ISL-47]
MDSMAPFSDPVLSQRSAETVIQLAKQYTIKTGRKPVFMEVCGSHTMALAKTGVKTRLKDYVRLIAGPGCPVCVTDQKTIDSMISLSEDPRRILCTFGDMVRVPGSKHSLMDAKTEGKDIRIVYSPLDSLRIAEENPDREIVFLGIGFETTIPLLAAAIKEAEKRGLNNFTIWMTTKLVEPVLRSLLEAGEIHLDGFLLPGHVSIVLGKESYSFLAEEYKMPGVISGFEPVQLLSSIYKLLQLCLEKKADIINDYPYIVSEKGNLSSQSLMQEYLKHADEDWRGIGTIPSSGMVLKEEFEKFDAKKKFKVITEPPRKTKCRCGEVIRGLVEPEKCVLFKKACTPSNPIGPCMVSAEGTCAAHYHYMREE